MAYNSDQQGAFWDFVRSISENPTAQRQQGEGVDHHQTTQQNPFAGFNPQGFGFGHPPPPPPPADAQGVPILPPTAFPPPGPPPSGPGFGSWWNPRDSGEFAGHRGSRHGRGGGRHSGRHSGEEFDRDDGEGRSFGRHGRHGRRHRSRSRSHSRSVSGDREMNEDAEKSGDEAADRATGESNADEAREGGRRGHHGRRKHSPHHAGPRGFGGRGRGHHGRGGFGAFGAYDGPHGMNHHHGGRHGGPRGGRHGPPPPPPPFDMAGVFRALSSHPIAQAFAPFVSAYQAPKADHDVQVETENGFQPPCDIFNTPAAFIIHVSLPGAKKEDVGVNWDADKGELNIAGVVYRIGGEEFLQTLTTAERKVGMFERNIKLPPTNATGERDDTEIDAEGITAKLEDGVLAITVRKLEREWTDIKKVSIN